MKKVILGDIHGRKIWKDIIDKESPNKIVFVGDYFDSWDIPGQDQIFNFLEIIELRKAMGENCELLLGNHDLSYLYSWARCSGYQNYSAKMINAVLEQHKHALNIATYHKQWLISHAGVTQTWLNKNKDKWIQDEHENIAEFVNDLFHFHPEAFEFDGYDSYGDDITQSPMWVRPQSLFQDGLDYQIVGHTGMRRIAHPIGDKKFYFIDVLDQSNEYLVFKNDDENPIISSL